MKNFRKKSISILVLMFFMSGQVFAQSVPNDPPGPTIGPQPKASPTVRTPPPGPTIGPQPKAPTTVSTPPPPNPMNRGGAVWPKPLTPGPGVTPPSRPSYTPVPPMMPTPMPGKVSIPDDFPQGGEVVNYAVVDYQNLIAETDKFDKWLKNESVADQTMIQNSVLNSNTDAAPFVDSQNYNPNGEVKNLNQIMYGLETAQFGDDVELLREAGTLPSENVNREDFKSPPGPMQDKLFNLKSKLLDAHPTNPQGQFGKKVGLAAVDGADKENAKGNTSGAEGYYRIGVVCLDIALGFIPVVGSAKALYEGISGKSILTGESLSKGARIISLVAAATLGFGTAISAIGGLKVIEDIAVHIPGEIKAIERLGTEAGLIGEGEKAIQRAGRIIESAENVAPKLGNKYVKELPDLNGSIKDAFEGHVFKGTYEPGEILTQAQRIGQTKPGNWFGAVKPINAQEANELYNIKIWGNEGGQIKAFKVKERVSGYAGKVAGGEGHQFFIPKNVPIEDVLEEIIY